MALTEEQDRGVTMMREKLSGLDNESFMATLHVQGVARAVADLVSTMPEDARAALFASLKAAYPADFT